ncbi:MAG: hypothetical protein O3B31_02335 [Chloroflexi bacterium]|nr:hypothetical protein [Chloroflexota bacterium]MDA1002180.1 hypothetical protein [Chloroflexota bacterium]
MSVIHGDNGIAIDLDQLDEAVAGADLIVIAFEFWPERLLIDLRDDAHRHTPPLIEVVEPVGGVAERNLWLSTRRPGVSPADQFLFFTWPQSVTFLARSVLPVHIARRLQAEQGLDMREALQDVFDELAILERREASAAVRGGEGYETIWSGQPA